MNNVSRLPEQPNAPKRDENGRFVKGTGGRPKGSKNKLTKFQLEAELLRCEEGGVSSQGYWASILDLTHPLFTQEDTGLQAKDILILQDKAAANLAKYFIDAGFDTEAQDVMAGLNDKALKKMVEAIRDEQTKRST